MKKVFCKNTKYLFLNLCKKFLQSKNRNNNHAILQSHNPSIYNTFFTKSAASCNKIAE